MKTSIISAVIILLVSTFLCPTAMSAPSMPGDLQMVEPDPSLPKEIAGFWGKWEGTSSLGGHFIVVEKIDREKASIYVWRSYTAEGAAAGWTRYEGQVFKDYGKYKICWPSPFGRVEVSLKGNYLDWSGGSFGFSVRLMRVP